MYDIHPQIRRLLTCKCTSPDNLVPPAAVIPAPAGVCVVAGWQSQIWRQLEKDRNQKRSGSYNQVRY